MPVAHANRWKCQIVSPITNDVLWEGEGPTTRSIVSKYEESVGNGYLTLQKLNRCSLGRSKNPLIKLWKIGEFGSRNMKPEVLGHDNVKFVESVESA